MDKYTQNCEHEQLKKKTRVHRLYAERHMNNQDSLIASTCRRKF